MEFLCSKSQMGEIDYIIQEMNKKKAHYPRMARCVQDILKIWNHHHNYDLDSLPFLKNPVCVSEKQTFSSDFWAFSDKG